MKKRWTSILAALALTLLLGACNGTITSIEIPADSPYEELATAFYSSEPFPYAAADGAGLDAEVIPILAPTSGDEYGVAVCTGATSPTETRDYIRACGASNGGDPFCSDALDTCIDTAPPDIVDPAGTVSVKEIRFQNILAVSIDRGLFTSGVVGVFRDSDDALESTVRVKISGTGTLRVIAGRDDGLVPGFTDPPGGFGLPGFADELGWLEAFPPWEEFGPGLLCADGGFDCTDDGNGLPTDEFVALCETSGFGSGNVLLYRTSADAGLYPFACGNVPVEVVLDAPRPLKQMALEDLQGLLPTGDSKTDRGIRKAIRALEKSLADNLWVDDVTLDPKKGKKVFDEEKKAAKEIEKLLDDDSDSDSDSDSGSDSDSDSDSDGGDLDPAVADTLIEDLAKLVLADDLLAESAIDDAILRLSTVSCDTGGGDDDSDSGSDSDSDSDGGCDCAEAEEQIAKAQEELAKGRTDADAGEAEKAIGHYKKAWEKAQKALKALADCPDSDPV